MNTPSPQVASGFDPVTTSDRFVLLDALRALALVGVCFANLEWFAGYRLVPKALAEHWPLVDKVTMQLSHLFIDGKAFGLFSLLFGVGFAVQLHRAEARGTDGARFFARRLGILLMIGAVHALLLWYGDILQWYALVGFALLLFRHYSDRALLRWGVGLSLMGFLVNLGWHQLVPALPSATYDAHMDHAVRTFAGPSYGATLAANLDMIWEDQVLSWGPPVAGCWILARLLLGYCFGRWAMRTGFFQNPAAYARPLRRLFGWALVVGLGGGLLFRAVSVLLLAHRLNPDGYLVLIREVLRDPVDLALSVAYAAGFGLLALRARWAAALGVLAPMGQMALTNYLVQTLVGLWLCYGYGLGLGLIGHIGPFASVGVCTAEVLAQLAFSHWWMRRFRFGPAEWLWRSLSYGYWQPLRRPIPALVAFG